MTAAAWPTPRSTTTRRPPTVTAFTRRALDWFLDHGIVAERLMTDNAFTYIHNKTLRELLLPPRDRSPAHPALHAPHQRQGRALPADPATRVGLRPANTPQATPVAPHCHTGSATTTSGAPTAPSATALPSTAFGRSPGTTARCAGVADAQRRSATAAGRRNAASKAKVTPSPLSTLPRCDSGPRPSWRPPAASIHPQWAMTARLATFSLGARLQNTRGSLTSCRDEPEGGSVTAETTTDPRPSSHPRRRL